MTQPTVISTNSKAQDSRVLFSNIGGAIKKVSSVTATTIVLSDSTGLGNKTLYASGTPGQVEILQAASSANHGKVANITGFATNTLTVSVDFSAILADGDMVLVLPPLSSELFTNGGHGLKTGFPKDETRGMGQTFLTHNTRMGVSVGGPISVYNSIASEGAVRLAMAGIGGYKKSGTGIHQLRPFKADNATFAQVDDFTVLTKDGNSVVQRAWTAMFGTGLTYDYPQNGVSTITLDTLGAAVAREVGGTGKAFTTGANNWIPSATQGDVTKRHTFRGVFVETGGSFGTALGSGDGIDRYVQSCQVKISRGSTTANVLGNEFITKPIEQEHMITVTGRRILEDDTQYEASFGGSTAASPGAQTETRLLVKAVYPEDTTKYQMIDIPKGMFTAAEPVPQDGFFLQDFTFVGMQTVDANNQVDTANPLYQLEIGNAIDTDFGAVL